MKKHQVLLEEDRYYHIYNRGNNSEIIFFNEGNYEFFLKRFNEYLSENIELFAYCLLPNHFHFLIRVKENLLEQACAAKALHLTDAKLLHGATRAFHRLFTSYSKAINKQQNRHGSLIENPFKRIEITSEEYLRNLIIYIHTNPQLHGFVKNFSEYKWSSYQEIISTIPHRSMIQNNPVLEWFGGKENFIHCHNDKSDYELMKSSFFD
jgi:REP element-mobilizing transposase RayT